MVKKLYYRVVLVSFIIVYIALCLVIIGCVYEDIQGNKRVLRIEYLEDMVDFKQSVIDDIRTEIDTSVNSIYELDYKNEIELNTKAIEYLQELDNL